MKTLLTFSLAALLAAPAAVAAQTPAPAPAGPSVIGTWDATFNSQQGQIPAQVTLRKDGDKLVGTIASQMGESPIEAEAKDKTLTIWFNFAGQGGTPVAIEMVGTVDGDKIKGSFSAGGTNAGDWLATRAKDSASDAKPADKPADEKKPAATASLTGDWAASVELPNMTATPGITLKQDGEKLTGDYVSAQYGKFAINGTVKGSDVTFWFAMSVEGTALNVTYTGKIDADGSLKGSVNYGDMMSGTFSATKKK
jgi:hypothetical protein